jgi:hypothetical protein
MDIYFASISDLGKSLYEQRLYKEAALVFEIATTQTKNLKVIC